MKKIFIITFLGTVYNYAIHPSLLSKRFNEISFIQIHDATSNMASIVQDQDRTLSEQLRDGARSIKIPVHFDYENPLGYYQEVLNWYLNQINKQLATEFSIATKQKEIEKLKREIDKAPWYRKIDIGITNSAKITAIGAEITGIETERAGVLLQKEVIEGALKFIEHTSPAESRKHILYACHGLPKGELYRDYIKDLFGQAPKEIKPALDLVQPVFSKALKEITIGAVGTAEQKGGVFPYSACFIDPARERLIDVANKIYNFLVSNPQEIFVLKIEEYIYGNFTPIAEVLMKANLNNLAWTQDNSKPWPTIQEMIDANKRLVILTTSHQKEYPWIMSYFDFDPWQAKFDFDDPETFDLKNVNPVKEFSNPYFKDINEPHNKLLTMHHTITKGTHADRDIAKKINAFNILYPRAKKLQEFTGHIPNFISVDYYEYPNMDVFKVQNALNGIS